MSSYHFPVRRLCLNSSGHFFACLASFSFSLLLDSLFSFLEIPASFHKGNKIDLQEPNACTGSSQRCSITNIFTAITHNNNHLLPASAPYPSALSSLSRSSSISFSSFCHKGFRFKTKNRHNRHFATEQCFLHKQKPCQQPQLFLSLS